VNDGSNTDRSELQPASGTDSRSDFYADHHAGQMLSEIRQSAMQGRTGEE